MKKTTVYAALIVVLSAAVLFLYNAYNGNPLSKVISKGVLGSYLEEMYPEKSLRIEGGFYNFKFGEYEFQVIETGEGGPVEYEFKVRGFIKPQVDWDGIYYTHLDEPLMSRLSLEAGEELAQLLSPQIPNLMEVEPEIEISQGTYEPTVDWHKDLQLEKPMALYMMLDSTNQSAEKLYRDAVLIQRLLNEAGYTYEHVTINGNAFDHEDDDNEGYVVYYLGFAANTELKQKDVVIWGDD